MYNNRIIENLLIKKSGDAKKKKRIEYTAVDKLDGNPTDDQKKALMHESNYSDRIVLCKSARVMFRGPATTVMAYSRKDKVSIPVRVVNGTMGTVTDFCRNAELIQQWKTLKRESIVGKFTGKTIPEAIHVEIDGYPGYEVLVGEIDEQVELEGVRLNRTQYAVVVCFAMTVHKAQGQTFNNVHVALQGYFAHGLFYVAISRARSLSGLTLDRSMNLKLTDVQRALTRHRLIQSFFDTSFPGIYGPTTHSQGKRKLDEFER